MAIPQSELHNAMQRIQAFEQAPDLQQAHDQALAAQQPLEPPSPGPEPRTTSFAKTLDEGYRPPDNALDTLPVEQGRGSEMIEQDRPEPEPTNTMPEAGIVKQSEFDKAWTAEQENAAAYQAELAAASERAQDMEAEIEVSREHEQGMEM